MKLDTFPPTLREHECISLLFANDPWLLDFLLSADRRSLRLCAEDLVSETVHFSFAHQVLVRLALVFWQGEGEIAILDVFLGLDEVRFECFLMAIQRIRSF